MKAMGLYVGWFDTMNVSIITISFFHGTLLLEFWFGNKIIHIDFICLLSFSSPISLACRYQLSDGWR